MSWLKRYAGNGRVAGIDLTPAALNFCGRRGHITLAQASVTNLPFPDSMFDLVTSFDVLYQLAGEGSDELAIREMQRVLRPSGIAFVRVAAYQWMRSSHDDAQETQRRYSLSELVGKMRDNGLEVLRATYANSALLPMAIMRRLVLERIGLAQPGSEVKPWPAMLQWLNRPLKGVLQGEARLLKYSGVSFPVGLSAICVARKPPQVHASNVQIASDTSRISPTLS